MNYWPFVALFVIGLGPLRAEDWPQWRGPNRTGVTDGSQLPNNWPADPPSPRWRLFVGEGHSSPAVADGRVFIMGRENDELEADLCFDCRTGEQLWRHAYAAPYKPDDSCGGHGPNSTPTVDGDRVFMFGLGGMLNCLDVKTGRVLWAHDCAAEYWRKERDATGDNPSFPPCGASASGLVAGNVFIVPVGDKTAGAITAFDLRTGEIVWKGLSERSSYGSPMLAEPAGKRQIIGFTGLRMVGLDADNGELLWEREFKAYFQQTILTPVIWNDLVIFGGERGPTMALRISPRDGAFSADPAWSSPRLRSYLTSSVLMGDHLVGFDDRQKQLACIELSTGELAWTSPKIGEHVSLVVAGKNVLALNSDNELYVLEATPRNFSQVAKWKISENGGSRAHLAVAGNCLYVKEKEHLLCLEATEARQ
jgi:outer membrane protein assembly factor BamB